MKVNDFYKNIYSTSSIKALESKFNYLSYDKKININEFLDKYKFTHLLLNSGDIMFKLSEIDGYKLIYLDKEYEYKLYVREDLIKTDTPEIKELYIRI